VRVPSNAGPYQAGVEECEKADSLPLLDESHSDGTQQNAKKIADTLEFPWDQRRGHNHLQTNWNFRYEFAVSVIATQEPGYLHVVE
jgi:hypothetical protein